MAVMYCFDSVRSDDGANNGATLDQGDGIAEKAVVLCGSRFDLQAWVCQVVLETDGKKVFLLGKINSHRIRQPYKQQCIHDV